MSRQHSIVLGVTNPSSELTTWGMSHPSPNSVTCLHSEREGSWLLVRLYYAQALGRGKVLTDMTLWIPTITGRPWAYSCSSFLQAYFGSRLL